MAPLIFSVIRNDGAWVVEHEGEHSNRSRDKAAANAAKLGQTFADANRSAKSGVAIRDIAKSIMNVGEGEAIDSAIKPKSSLLGKFDLKSMLSGSKKSKGAPAAAEA